MQYQSFEQRIIEVEISKHDPHYSEPKKPEVSLLQQMIASLIDLRYRAKHAHWNYKGPEFYSYHLLFDRMYDDYEEFIDRLGERAAGKGQIAPGNIRLAVEQSQLSGVPISEEQYTYDLKEALVGLSEFSGKGIKSLTEQGDDTSANIFCEIQERVDQHAFLLRE